MLSSQKKFESFECLGYYEKYLLRYTLFIYHI